MRYPVFPRYPRFPRVEKPRVLRSSVLNELRSLRPLRYRVAGQGAPWTFFVTGPTPLNMNRWTRAPV